VAAAIAVCGVTWLIFAVAHCWCVAAVTLLYLHSSVYFSIVPIITHRTKKLVIVDTLTSDAANRGL
jgi:hypothetical protein